MLGKTAGGLFWMFRYLERCENTARLVDAGLRISLTVSSTESDEWISILSAAGVEQGFTERHDECSSANAIDYLLRDRTNPSCVLACIENARTNARMVRTALTREVWEAVNEAWMSISGLLKRAVHERDLPDILADIRRQTSIVRGAMDATMIRDDRYNFSRIGTFLERADNTSRILDVKYYVLLPSQAQVGSKFDNIQWEMILRAVSSHRSYLSLNNGEISAHGIAQFLILDEMMPRSLVYAYDKVVNNLAHIAGDYSERAPCQDQAEKMLKHMQEITINDVFDFGLHEFIMEFLQDNFELGLQIEQDYRFTG